VTTFTTVGEAQPQTGPASYTSGYGPSATVNGFPLLTGQTRDLQSRAEWETAVSDGVGLSSPDVFIDSAASLNLQNTPMLCSFPMTIVPPS
jgi:hypothetical protein